MTHSPTSPPYKISDHIFHNIIAAIISRGLAVSLLHPLDVAKTRMQVQKKNTGVYTTTLSSISSIIKNEGPMALTKGLSVRWMYIVPGAAVQYTIYEQVKHAILSRKWERVPVALLFGIMVKGFMTLSRTPFDIIKQHRQLSGMGSSKEITIREIVKMIRNQQGYLGFFNSFHVTIIRDLLFSGSYFTSYEIVNNTLFKLSSHAVMGNMIAGGFAGLIGTVVSIPFDVVKTRLQVQSMTSDRYNGMFNAFIRIYKEEGTRAFFKGLGPRIISTIPSASLTFTFYEQMKKILARCSDF
jgi:hypothetical protein